MRISLEWLREFIEPAIDAASIAERLTMAGTAVESFHREGDDVVFEMDITTNRPDCLSHYGIARELAALSRRPLAAAAAGAMPRESKRRAERALEVKIAAPAACARYCARVIETISVQPSPAAIVERLERIGQRSINNIADLTNYVLWEVGHPTHAFDADTLRGQRIEVRYARAGEKLVTLDAIERKLDTADLVIADAERPVALAGVMGGAETAISPATRRVALESAWFEPVGVRRTAKRHGMHTDASHRFERGADPEAAPRAANLIAARIQQMLPKAEVLAGLIDVYPAPLQRAPVELRAAEIARILGAEVPAAEVAAILERLGFGCRAQSDGRSWTVELPSWRLDVSREIDLIEEVARIYGFDKFAPRLPIASGAARSLPGYELSESIRQRLRGRGYSEIVALSFASAQTCEPFMPGGSAAQAVEVVNPIREEAPILRTSALPAMLEAVAGNLNRGQPDVRLFEMGKVYRRRTAGNTGSVEERRVLTLAACGRAEGEAWVASEREQRDVDFFDLKSDVERALDSAQLGAIEFRPLADPAFHPTRAAEALAAGQRVARLGQLHSDVAAGWKLRREILVAEVELEALYAAGLRRVGYRAPSKFPASERDFSFIFDERVRWADALQAIASLRLENLVSLEPVEVFRGANLPPHSYSLLLRLRFQRDDRTLREEEVQAESARAVAALEALGGTQRR